jgi:hypothetical protein
VASDYLLKLREALPSSPQRTVNGVRRAGRLTALVRIYQILLEGWIVLPQVVPQPGQVRQVTRSELVRTGLCLRSGSMQVRGKVVPLTARYPRSVRRWMQSFSVHSTS